MEGIYLINKPEGISSYDCIRKLKKALSFKKIGHAGTLDPFASGLLVVLVGKATKLATKFLNDDKTYVGTILLGKATNSYDITGEVVSELDNFELNESNIDQTLKNFQGEILQTPPIYSALKKDGKKLYEYAKRGEQIVINQRLINVKSLKRTSNLYNNKFDFYADVSKGTYIRSLAFDIGISLNIPSCLFSLKRTKSGIFNLEEAYNIDDIKEGIKPSLSIEDYAKTLEKVIIEPYLENHVKNAIQLDSRQTTTNNMFSVYNNKGKLLAIYVPKKGKYNPIIILGD